MSDAIYIMGCLGAFLAWRESGRPFSFWVLVAAFGWPAWIVYDYLTQRADADEDETKETKP